MATVFVSYRRSDSSASTGRIADRLQLHFGDKSIFYDVDTIPLGIDFRQYLNERLDQCDVFLAIIGDQWLNAQDSEGGRRLDEPADNVRIEIGSALKRGDKIPVIPVLVGESGMPKESDLPGELKELAFRNAIEVRSSADFDGQISRLITAIERIIEREDDGESAAQQVPGPSAAEPTAAPKKPEPTAKPTAPPVQVKPASSGSKTGLIGATVAVLAALGIWWAISNSGTETEDTIGPVEPVTGLEL